MTSTTNSDLVAEFKKLNTNSEKHNTNSDLVAELEKLHNERSTSKLRVSKNTFSVWDHPELSVTRWKFADWDYHKKGDLMPTKARGLFTIGSDIAARGYDKFFNVNEVKSTQWESLERDLVGPFYATLKENGCLVLMAGRDGKLIVTSKHSSGPRENDVGQHNHSRAARDWVLRHLAKAGSNEKELAAELESRNMTAVGELCDDDFEEHVLSYSDEASGIYLTGLNYNERIFRTAHPAEVQALATKFGFHATEFLEFADIKPLREFLEECATTGSWAGRHIEGFVVRGHLASDGADSFFKYKFQEPYLMYRQWRKVTEQYLNHLKDPVSKPSPKPSGLHRVSAEKYLHFIIPYLRSHKDVLDVLMAGDGKGFLNLRDAYLASADMTEQELVDLATGGPKWILVTVATLGCGKTTVSVALEKLLGWGHVQNDSLTGARKPQRLVSRILEGFEDHDVMILDRNNPMLKERAQIFDDVPEMSLSEGYDIHYVCLNFLPHGPTKAESDETWKRVLGRGDNHQTIRGMAPAQINGIMKDFERRFTPVNRSQEPDSKFDLVIDLTVGPESSEKNVNTIISTMAKTYPELGIEFPSAAAVRSAVVAAYAYQPEAPAGAQSKPKVPKAPPISYFALGLDDVNRQRILDAIAGNIPEGMTPVPEFHVTVAHRTPHKERFKELKQANRRGLEGVNKRDVTKPVWLPLKGEIKITSLCINDRVAALTVELGDGLESSNTHPHITVALGEEVPAVESNKMLKGKHTEIPISPINVPVQLYAM